MPLRVLFGADAGGGSTPAGGDAERTDAQIEELARDAVGKALADGGAESASDLTFAPNDAADKIVGALKPGVVDAANLDADDADKQRKVDKQRKLRDAINAEAKLRAGTAVSIGAPDADGVRTIGVHPRPADGPLGAKDAYDQQALDHTSKWKMEVIQYRKPHVIPLTLGSELSEHPGTYRGSVEIAPGASARLEYVPLSHKQTAPTKYGTFTVTITTKPDSTARTVSERLFSGKTVRKLRLHFGVDKDSAKAAETAGAAETTVDVGPGTSNATTLVLNSNRLDADPPALTEDADTFAVINFLFESTEPGTGTVKKWKLKGSSDRPKIAEPPLPEKIKARRSAG